MEKLKEVNWGPTLMISILFGYLGIDRFILKRKKLGFFKLGAFILSVLTFYFFDNLLRLTLYLTTGTINGTKGLLISLSAGEFLIRHLPKIIGLAVLTLLVMVFLILGILILVWWIEDIIMILKKEEIDGIKWK